MPAIRSFLFNIFFFTWSTLIMLTAWIVLPLPRRFIRNHIGLWPKLNFPVMRWLVGTRFEVRGRQNIPNEPVIFAAKHQSAWDTMFFLWLDPANAYIMKAELGRIPFWGWYMRRCGHIMIDRTGGAGTMREMMRATRAVLDDGRSVVIFPEGTRTMPGITGTYHPGIAALYSQTGATVIPVALNSGLFWPRRSFLKKPGTIVIEFLEPMPAGMKRADFLVELEKRIETATRRLETEAAIT
ncbi:MAG: putative 1-acylglycerol-3-phosphate O-acyltransferase [Rhodospirillales bacterium]|jgi:1-acyl-sn-glycerol-3-phosphate acyltransferase|nr:putative 1-acylglycerol-3-phosphate O-acyltransferase [Rhodospirillales bacterium]